MHNFFDVFLGSIKGAIENPAAAALIGAWVITTLGVICRTLPGKIWDFAYRQCTTRLLFSSMSTGWNNWNQMQYAAFIQWFSKNPWFKYSRVITIEGADSSRQSDTVGPGVGKHFFIWKGHFFIFRITKEEKPGSTMAEMSVDIHVLGRSKEPLYALMEEFVVKRDTRSLDLYAYGGKEWSWVSFLHKRKLDTVVVNKQTKDDLVETLDHFYNNKEWYEQRGFNYKKTIMLYGAPGTGKTSLIKAIASHYEKSLYVINLSAMSGESFFNALTRVREGSIVVIEDIDAVSATHSRETNKLETLVKNQDDDKFSFISLSEILNALDGVAALHDVVVFMTTNHPEVLDPALTRKGRVDQKVEIGPLHDTEIKTYLGLLYTDQQLWGKMTFNPITGAELQGLYFEYKEDQRGLLQALNDGVKPEYVVTSISPTAFVKEEAKGELKEIAPAA